MNSTTFFKIHVLYFYDFLGINSSNNLLQVLFDSCLQTSFTDLQSLQLVGSRVCYYSILYTEQIRNRSQPREAAQTIKFMIKINCLGTYDVE